MHHEYMHSSDTEVASASATLNDDHSEEYYEDDESAVATGVWATGTSTDRPKKAGT